MENQTFCLLIEPCGIEIVAQTDIVFAQCDF